MTNRELRISICGAIVGIILGAGALSTSQDLKGQIAVPSSITMQRLVQGVYKTYYFTGAVNYPDRTGLFCNNINSLQVNTDCITGTLPSYVFSTTTEVFPIVSLKDDRIFNQAYSWNGTITTINGRQYLVFSSRMMSSLPRLAVSPSELENNMGSTLVVGATSSVSSAATVSVPAPTTTNTTSNTNICPSGYTFTSGACRPSTSVQTPVPTVTPTPAPVINTPTATTNSGNCPSGMVPYVNPATGRTTCTGAPVTTTTTSTPTAACPAGMTVGNGGVCVTAGVTTSAAPTTTVGSTTTNTTVPATPQPICPTGYTFMAGICKFNGASAPTVTSPAPQGTATQQQQTAACKNVMNVAAQLSPYLSNMNPIARDSMLNALNNSIQRNCTSL